MNHRQQLILETINRKKKVRVNELADLTKVSLVTIRNDLTFLEQQSYVKRSHGFVELSERDNVDERIQLNFSVKQKLAKYAASLVQIGDTIFIEGGSTNALLARELLHFNNELMIATTCTYIASLLKDAKFDVILFGGVVQSKSESVVGPLTRSCISLTPFNKAFLGIDGYHQDYGFTGRDMMRADTINCILDKGAINIVIADSTKFGQIYAYPLTTNKVNHLITDSTLDLEIEQSLVAQKIQIHKA